MATLTNSLLNRRAMIETGLLVGAGAALSPTRNAAVDSASAISPESAFTVTLAKSPGERPRRGSTMWFLE